MGKRTMVAAVSLALLSGCTTYYKVHDPTTGKDYYTTKLDQKKSGSTTLTDDRTKKMVTVQNSEVQKIKKEEYEVGINPPPPPPPPEPAPNPFK